MTTIYVVGVGPGDPAYLTEKARRLLADARRVVGFQAALQVVEPLLPTTPTVMTYRNQEAVIRALADETTDEGDIVLCCWGDPSVSDRELLERLWAAGLRVEIVPGISSVQIACARLQIPLEAALFITFHKRGDIVADRVELLEALRRGRRHVIALPRPWDFMPVAMARWLLEEGLSPARTVWVLERLTLPDERVQRFTLTELAAAEEAFSDLSIVVFP